LALVQFPVLRDVRSMRITFANEIDLLTYDELNERVLAVYKSWGAVTERRARDRQRG
jgi:hypothetical protein